MEELGTFLDSASTRWTIGTNLFLNAFPDEPNRATSLVEYGGSAPVHVFSGDLPSFENPRIAVTCRSTSSVTARADAGAAWVELQRIANESLSGKSYLRCVPVQSPFLLGRDEQNRPSFRFNLDVMRRTTST